MRCTRITITRVNYKPAAAPDVNEELQYLGGALGLFNLRDKDKSRFRIFITLLKSLKRQEGMSSDELAEALGISRATIIHHLDSLMEAGIVENNHSKYMLRVDNLEELLTELQEDLDKTMVELKEIARNVDKELGLNSPRKQPKNRTPF